jgi:hypothetical protein
LQRYSLYGSDVAKSAEGEVGSIRRDEGDLYVRLYSLNLRISSLADRERIFARSSRKVEDPMLLPKSACAKGLLQLITDAFTSLRLRNEAS